MRWKNGREWERGFSAESKEREGEETKREVSWSEVNVVECEFD